MTISPDPHFPERAPQVYERAGADNPVRRGPLRFEEGIGLDFAVGSEFSKGMASGQASAQGRPNRNAPVWEKSAEETLNERAHPGSASWIEAPEFLGEFAHGSFSSASEATIETAIRSGGRTSRLNPTVVTD